MSNAENEEARRRYYIAFNNRGTPQNLDLLGEATRLNREIAGLYGLPSYAHFVTRRRMVESPETVHRFLDEVEGKVREVERREIGELRAFKAERLGKSVREVTLNRWDLPYYQEQLKKARYNIDQEALRAYFPTDASVAWVFAISGSQYGRQHLYASYDMTLFGEREVDPMQGWIRMEGETPTGYVPDTQFPGTFGHLVGGYGAGYYGYMWSEVLALDMLSVYGKNLMNPAVGRRFRELIHKVLSV